MATTKNLDCEAIAKDYEAGMSADKCAEKYGCHHTTVRQQLAKRGVYKPGKPRGRRSGAPARLVAISGREVLAEAARENGHEVIRQPAAAAAVQQPPYSGNGPARCRAVMFEVEGNASNVQDAINAVKAALENRD